MRVGRSIRGCDAIIGPALYLFRHYYAAVPTIGRRQCRSLSTGGQIVTINNLRLVALPNQLLIAGTPDEASLKARMHFVRQLQDSPWQSKLPGRHGNVPLPPLAQHFIAYRAEYLPARFREYFERHQLCNYGDVSSQARLAFTHYNWTQVFHGEC